MKEVMAIIRLNMINKTKNALAEAGIVSMHVKDVTGRGNGYLAALEANGNDADKHWREQIGEYSSVGRLVPKRKISMILPDNLVHKAVQTVISVNQTGKSGDGKIFVLPVSETVRIRDGLAGNDVLDF
ncbi:MAG: P-II family nitrogen regulator [Planctomycetaceae bacterium]|jgi:nitrogen regulatory protein PII 2|nr:P-II family nitrogen regulator [Planctomycetaceae bacterium]